MLRDLIGSSDVFRRRTQVLRPFTQDLGARNGGGINHIVGLGVLIELRAQTRVVEAEPELILRTTAISLYVMGLPKPADVRIKRGMRPIGITAAAKSIEEEPDSDHRATFLAIIFGIGCLVLRHLFQHGRRRSIHRRQAAGRFIKHFYLPAASRSP
ncbi:hypothetical protein D3C87_1644920 [compost metagenome]